MGNISTAANETSTMCHNSSIVMIGERLLLNHLTTILQKFAIDERSGGHIDLGSGRTLYLSKKVPAMLEISDCALSCCNVAFHIARNKSRMAGLNTTEVIITVQCVVNAI